jgi:hypothetical protein
MPMITALFRLALSLQIAARQEEPPMSSCTRLASKASMATFVTLASLAPLAPLAGCAADGSGVSAEPAAAQSARLSAPSADECAFVTHEALSDLLVPIDQAIELSDIDKAANGVTGAYASAANSANDYLHQARAKVVEMDDLITQNGNPIYSMGAWYSFRSAEAWNQLDAGNWWLQVSAAYHHSQEARNAMELAGEAMERAATLRMHAVRCYTDAYIRSTL